MDHHQRSSIAAAATKVTTESQRPAKKRKRGVDIESLSREELAIVSKAAANLEVPLPDLPLALGRLHSLIQSPSASRAMVRSRNRRPVRRRTKVSLVTMARGSSPGAAEESERTIPVPQSTDVSTSAGNSCLPNYFGFDMTLPQQWSDCFASLVPDHNPMLDSGAGTMGDYYSSMLASNTSPMVATNDLLAAHPMNISQPSANASVTLPWSTYQQNLDIFACDDQKNGTFPFLESYPPLQPSAVATTQPPLPEGMEYPYLSLHKESYSPDQTHTACTTSNGYDALSSSSSLDVSGSDVVESKEKRSRRGMFKDPRDREQTALTRKAGACLRCKMQKLRCDRDPSDPLGACLACKTATMKFSKLACLRYKITDVKMFHTTPAPGRTLTERWSYTNMQNMSTWALNSSIETIKVTQDYVAKPLSLKVRRFVPVEGDILHRSWFDKKLNVKKMVNLPPYALVDLDAGEKEYFDHINESGAEFFHGILDINDKFVWTTYSMAIARANDSHTPEEEQKVLKSVLRLWVTVRLMNRSEHIVGENTLSMPKDMMKAALYMEKSLFHLFWGINSLLSLYKDCRSRFAENSWFTIYLCIFILLHNCSMLTEFEEWYARKHGRQTRYLRMSMVAEYHLGAVILLSYFHYCCKGCHPFSLDWNSNDTKSMAELDDGQVKFIRQSAAYVKNNETRYKDLRKSDQYEDPHFFIAQLYEDEWVPKMTTV